MNIFTPIVVFLTNFTRRGWHTFLDWPWLILSLAFVRKELFGTLRQPRLLLSLIVGPFLTLAVFGLGYHGPGHYNTILVVPNELGISTKLSDYKGLTNDTFHIDRVTKDEAAARQALKQGDTDVVILVPDNTLDQIYNGQQSRFPVLYRSLNPVDSSYIEYSTYIYASEFDKVVLRQALASSKPQSYQLQLAVQQLNASTDVLDQSMQSGNLLEAQAQVESMRAVVQLTRRGLDSMILPGNSTSQTPQQKLLSGNIARTIFISGIIQIRSDLDDIDQNLNALQSGFQKGDLNSASQRTHLANIRADNASLSEKANRLGAIPPAVIVEPVLAAADNQVSTSVSYINFYGVAVVILLLQHIGITLASLSNVRDRLLGSFEIFRVTAINPTQILTGKFISFTLLLLSLSIILIGLITQLLGVPFVDFGSHWLPALLILLVTIYASIGLGYLVGGLAKSESQAVQLTMLLLLGSIFFTGFILPLNQFENYVRYISYALPISFGAAGLQNVMLDTRPLNFSLIFYPLLLGTLYLLLGRFFYKRQFDNI